MALLSNAGSFPPIKFSYLENEFGANGSRSLGAYRVSETIDGLTIPTIGWTNQWSAPIPNSGTIKFSDFYSKKLNMVVDYYADTTNLNKQAAGNNTMSATWRYQNQSERVKVVGGFRSRPLGSVASN